MFKKLSPKGPFARNVITLMTGTSIAQAIPIAISPILTRLYTPEDFGVFALYMAVASIVSVLVTGRYELAIMLPKKDSDAINIVALSIGLSCIISGVLLVIVAVFNNQITHMLGSPAVSSWLYFVPVTTFLMGIYQSLNYWSNRKGHYKRMALSRMMQSGSGSLTQLGSGYGTMGASGLVSGQIIGQTLSTAILGWLIYREDQSELKNIKRNRIIALAKKYSNFPKYLVVAHGFNTGSSQMPVILISTLFSSAIAGFYMLTQRVIGAPMTIVASAIGDVFRQEASHAYVHTGNCKAVYLKALKRLIAISVVPFAAFFFIAPYMFSFVFGKEWRISGEYAQILTPMFFLRFITSPLSSIFMIAQKQQLDLVWQILLFILVLSSFIFGYSNSNIQLVLVAFCASYCLMYAVNGVLSYKLATGARVL